MNKLLLSLLSLFISDAYALTATEVIKHSENADEHGYYTFLIKGFNFGSGPEIVLFDDFNNSSIGDNVSLASPLIGQWSSSTDYLGIPKIVSNNGSNAMQIHDTKYTDLNKIAQLEAILPSRGNDIFMSYSVTVPSGKFFSGSSADHSFPDHSSWKFTWITDGVGAIASTTRFNLCSPTHVGKGNFMIHGNSGGLGYFNFAEHWSWHTKNYFSFGQLPSNQNPTTENGRFIWQHTGKQGSTNSKDKSQPIMPSGVTDGFDRVKFPGWFNTKSNPFDAYYDDIYIAVGDNAFARVELSDAEDISNSIKNVIMPITKWDNDLIEIRIHEEHVKDSKEVFLRIYNAQNQSTNIILPGSKKSPAAHPSNIFISS